MRYKNGALKFQLDENGNPIKDKNGNYVRVGRVSDALIADEYMAEIAEQISKNKGKTTIPQRIVQAIRAFLRKIGINLELNENDIKHLLFASYRKLQGENVNVMDTALGRK